MIRLCRCCYGVSVPAPRWNLGYTTCLDCGDRAAKQVRHCSVPMNKSNYVLVTDASILRQLNPKRTTC